MEFLKSEKSIFSILLFIVCFYLISCISIEWIEVFHLTRSEAYDLAKDLNTNFITILTISLAISAIIFSIVQLKNDQSILLLVFKESYFFSLFYFVILNVIPLSIFILVGNDNSFISDIFFIKLINAGVYAFVLFLVFLIIIFQRVFKFLDADYLNDLYVSYVVSVATGNKHNERIKTRLSEEFLLKTSNSLFQNDQGLLDKNLNAYLRILEEPNEPSFSLRLFDKHPLFFVDTYKNNRSDILSVLLTFYYKCIVYALNHNRPLILYILSGLPRRIYLKLDDQKLGYEVVDDFFLRIREIIDFNIIYKDDVKISTQHQELIQPLLIDFSETIKILIEKGDFNSLENILNEISMTKAEVFRRYDSFESKIIFDELSESEESEYKLWQSIYFDFNAIASYNYYWLCFKIYQNIEFEKVPDNIITLLEFDNSLSETRLNYLFEKTLYYLEKKDSYFNWNDWIWNSEKRLNGQAYSMLYTDHFIILGFVISILKNQIVSSKYGDKALDKLLTESKSQDVIYIYQRV
ncbi:hypothetical protein [Solitalea koreensis]|uniref:Uncharacterized protein n=1 Tax=Solitalea koreensis TaxID=543615 RepID=A0A521BK64_9SPHI|nr:hypothetical protein [Solitalea koreensis]SMO47241.1 hypothetical protein SAMN06265350_102247 [Solitalea koreensis]